MLFGPDKKGDFQLSSELILGGSTYYIWGYYYEDSEYYRFPHEKDQVPDIINQEYRVIGRDGQRSEPGFKTPGESNGFALIGEFESLDEAREFYRDYDRVEEGLQFEVDSDTVKLYQVWIQKSSLGNYAKLLVTGIEYRQTEQGAPINEVQVEYIYQSNGSRDFPN